jgi:quinol-cytochrome oxidoreductase complex cytochrome b subunit
MIRILFKGLYKDPRELHWVSGASLLVLTLVICYTGTCLPADSLTHLGAGSVGGDGGMASNRNLFIVYVLHIACIPIMMSVLMGFHFLMIRRTGVSEPL